MTTIHGELDVAGRQIFLVAGGAVAEDVAVAAKQIATLTPLFKKSDPPGALVVPATWPVVVQLAHEFGQRWYPGPRLAAWTAEQVRQRTTSPRLTYAPPARLTARPYQRAGAALIAATGQALITDEPGTGKTITAILGLVDWDCQTEMGLHPTVVVCPASVVDHWVECWQTWAPQYSTVAWRGTPAKRAELVGTADVYVTSYGTAARDAQVGRKGPLQQLAPSAVVIDECHLIKTPTSQRSLAVRRLTKRAHAVIGLSGTPITHNPGDLWPTLDALCHEAWPSRERWVDRYCRVLSGASDYGAEGILGLHPHTEPEFRTALLGQHRRVAKADVLDQLPPKVYSVRTVELPPKWRKVYDDFEARMLAELPDGDELSVMDVLAKLTHLSSLSCAPCDVTVTTEVIEDGPRAGEEVEHVHLDLKAPSWKVDALLEVLEERPGESVVVFATRRDLVQLAGEAAADPKRGGRRVGYIIGGQTARERTATVKAFQTGELDVICATTQAGGVGLTLTAARTAVFLQRPWSLVDALQAEDRIHRIGAEQHESIEIVDIVASNTIDTRVRGVLREKGRQLADLVQDPRIVADLLGGASVTQLRRSA